MPSLRLLLPASKLAKYKNCKTSGFPGALLFNTALQFGWYEFMDIMDTTNYPVDQPDSSRYSALVALCQADLAKNSLFNLPGFLRPSALHDTLELAKPVIATKAFVHPRVHNIYFKKTIPDLAPDHPALQLRQTANHTICADQIEGSAITQLYD